MGLIPGLGRCPGGGNGNPLQYLCLANSTDRRAWWATVHRVAKSWMGLKWLSMHACTYSGLALAWGQGPKSRDTTAFRDPTDSVLKRLMLSMLALAMCFYLLVAYKVFFQVAHLGQWSAEWVVQLIPWGMRGKLLNVCFFLSLSFFFNWKGKKLRFPNIWYEFALGPSVMDSEECMGGDHSIPCNLPWVPLADRFAKNKTVKW